MGYYQTFPCPICGTSPTVHVYSGCDRCSCGRYRLYRKFKEWDDYLGPVYVPECLRFCNESILNVGVQTILERSLQHDELWRLEGELSVMIPEQDRGRTVDLMIELAHVSDIMTG